MKKKLIDAEELKNFYSELLKSTELDMYDEELPKWVQTWAQAENELLRKLFKKIDSMPDESNKCPNCGKEMFYYSQPRGGINVNTDSIAVYGCQECNYTHSYPSSTNKSNNLIDLEKAKEIVKYYCGTEGPEEDIETTVSICCELDRLANESNDSACPDNIDLSGTQGDEYLDSIIGPVSSGKALRYIRTGWGLSLRDLEKKTGIKYTNLSAYENDSKKMGLSVLKKLAIAFDLPITAFFGTENRDTGTIPEQTNALLVLDEQNDKFVESVCKRIRRDWDIIFPKTKSGFMEVARKYVRAIHNQLHEELKGEEDEKRR